MKTLVLIASLGLLAAGSSHASDQQAAPRALLLGAQCLDPAFARGWVYLDDRHILVDAGRYRYRIEFSSSCQDIGWTPVIGFRGDPVGGRVCGGPFDAVLTRDIPCRIQHMDVITRDQYNAIESQHSRDRKDRRAARRRVKAAGSP